MCSCVVVFNIVCITYIIHSTCSVVERLLAAQNPLSHADRPHQLFADAPPMGPGGTPLAVPMMPPPPPPGQPMNIPPPLGAMIPPPMNIPPPACEFTPPCYSILVVSVLHPLLSFLL